jgi:2-polyprenyl-3-methyl-5-hydroxy-6-metoxy-1,4-benzoquinol methylase
MNKKPLDYDFDRLYSEDYTLGQLKKFLLRNIESNDICHWHERNTFFIDELIGKLDLSEDSHYLDLGCNIGTFAIEFSARGKAATGVDLSQDAIRTAELMASYLQLQRSPTFVHGDISDASVFSENSFDVIIAQDILEHLHDDVLKKTLENCFTWLKPGGYFVYQTHPTKYDYLFHSRGWKSLVRLLPLVPSLIHGERKFKRAVERYHNYIINPVSKFLTGQTREQKIEHDAHCNLLTASEVVTKVEDSGMVSLFVKTENMYKSDRDKKRAIFFANREYFHRNIYGIAWKPII